MRVEYAAGAHVHHTKALLIITIVFKKHIITNFFFLVKGSFFLLHNMRIKSALAYANNVLISRGYMKLINLKLKFAEVLFDEYHHKGHKEKKIEKIK